MRVATLVLALLLLAAGGAARASADMEAASRAYLEELRRGDFANIVRDADDRMVDAGLPAAQRKMAGIFPPGEPTAVRVSGTRVHKLEGRGRIVETHFVYQFGERPVYAMVLLEEIEGRRVILGMRVDPEQPGAAAAKEAQRYVEWTQNALIGAGAAFLVLGLATVLVLEARAKRRRRRP
jgi:hypothetical protein